MKFYHFFTNNLFASETNYQEIDVTLDDFGLFVVEGSIIPVFSKKG
jgi:hypothetical protein